MIKNSALILAKHALSEVITIASILLFFKKKKKEFCLADQQLHIRLIALPNNAMTANTGILITVKDGVTLAHHPPN